MRKQTDYIELYTDYLISRVKPIVREVESNYACLIFDDTVQEKNGQMRVILCVGILTILLVNVDEI